MNTLVFLSVFSVASVVRRICITYLHILLCPRNRYQVMQIRWMNKQRVTLPQFTGEGPWMGSNHTL